MRLTVLNVAYPLAPVGHDVAGGAEQVLTQIDTALVRAGHRSLVLACEGSSAAGELITTLRIEGTLHGHMHAQAQALHRCWIERLVTEQGVDVVHLHGLDFHAYLPRPGVPVLVTLHLPAPWHAANALRIQRPGTFMHCVSRSQQRGFPPDVPLLTMIENGVPIDETPEGAGPPPVKKGNFVLTLARICPEKGVHLAIDAARRARAPALIAGRVFPFAAHEEYFASEIQPRLGGSVRFIGPVGAARKQRLLRAARALLIASTAPETSSLVAMEALACGTPVIAFAVGALPEIVDHGRTGFLVRDVAEMAAAIDAASTIDPEACRDVARRRFSAERMAASYLERYAQIARVATLDRGGTREEEAYAAA
jgi:glycosyltransferase involved in cell wall biosynthesis